MKQRAAYSTDETWNRVKAYAARNGLSMPDATERLLKAGLERRAVMDAIRRPEQNGTEQEETKWETQTEI